MDKTRVSLFLSPLKVRGSPSYHTGIPLCTPYPTPQTAVDVTCQSFRSIESGNHPTEASVRIAEQANEADGGAQALQDTIDALRGVRCDNPGDSGAAAEHHSDDHRRWKQQQQEQEQSAATLGTAGRGNGAVAAVTAADSASTSGGEMTLADEGKVGGDARDNQHQEIDQRKEKATDDNVSNAEEAGENEGWGDGEGDDYSEEEYEDSDMDDNEEVEQQIETGGNRPLLAGGAAVSTTSHGASAETETSKSSKKERVADGASLERDSDGRNEGGSRGVGNGTSRSGGEDVDPGAFGSDPAQNRANDAFATGDDSTNMSEVPVYLSGGRKVSTSIFLKVSLRPQISTMLSRAAQWSVRCNNHGSS